MKENVMPSVCTNKDCQDYNKSVMTPHQCVLKPKQRALQVEVYDAETGQRHLIGTYNAYDDAGIDSFSPLYQKMRHVGRHYTGSGEEYTVVMVDKNYVVRDRNGADWCNCSDTVTANKICDLLNQEKAREYVNSIP